MVALTRDEMATIIKEMESRLHARLDKTDKKVDKLHGVYFGNGTAGIKTEVAVLKTRVFIVFGILSAIGLGLLAVIGKLAAIHFGG